MSHGKIREDKNCLNCGSTVEERFCPKCGQENTENRKPFHYLFTHFVEDFTHYDGQFWSTIKNLLFNPGKLTNTYIEGKRQRFVPPVKLYIFISFVTFFLFALFPPYTINWDKKGEENTQITVEGYKSAINEMTQIVDSLKSQKNISAEDSLTIKKLNLEIEDSTFTGNLATVLDSDKEISKGFPYRGYASKKSYDSAIAKNPSIGNFIDRPIAHKYFELREKGVKKGDIYKNLLEISYHNLPKALFLYLPFFAFFLWLFHSKKKWWYFEHGVFTLHYFSFLLLVVLSFSFLTKIIGISDISIINVLVRILMIAILVYGFAYFFIAHRRVYKNHGVISFLIGWVLLLLNIFFLLFFLLGLAIISFLMIH